MPSRNKKLKIAQLAPLNHPISAKQNKAIYSHIANLVNGSSAKKHNVTLFGHADSEVQGKVRSVVFHDGEESKGALARYELWSLISDCYLDAKNKVFDLIHSHLNVMTGFFSRLDKSIPTLISIHSPIENWMKPILLKHKDEKYISFSLAQRKQLPELNWYANIYHGVDTDQFAFNERPEDYVLYLGRVTKEKGTHHAINACKDAGVNLRIAGRSYSTENYWHEMIEPHINGKTVRYFGEANLDEKIDLLQKARAVVFPTLYNEAFGYVLIEAMSCGTPVIAFPNGSVPEIVRDGVSGYLVNDEKEMAEALKKIDLIDRKEVRKRAEQFFSLKQMMTHYDSVYHRVVEESNYKEREMVKKQMFPKEMEL
jgi:glycosyltransferase involved in cell wall biosynthesis